MRLRTKNEIPNAGKNMFSTFDSKVTLEIIAHNEVSRDGNHTIEIEHRYFDDNNTDITPNSNVYRFNSSAEIDSFAESIKELIPANLSHTELSDFKVMIGAQMIMAQTLGIEYVDIEILKEAEEIIEETEE